MLFNSFQFLFFFPVVAVLFFLLPHRFRWIHLLISSCIFYCAFIPVYILVLFLTIIVDYTAGIFIEKATGSRRKMFLVLSIVTNLGVLAFFKYYNFFIGNVNDLLYRAHIHAETLPYLDIILPIGLSFHTFQAMSYTIEVYRGNQKAEKHLGIYSLYVMFFPQLVAGPIERPQHMIHQFREKKYFDPVLAVSGIQQMLFGLFKKVVVADALGRYVDSIYNHWEVNTGFTLLFATYAFAFQIYCDFSGYTDIAQGAARVMGFRLMDNFNLPYFARSVTEFWRRWHISLSTWLRDYLYISLGGNRQGKWNTYRNLMITMLLGGLWHGASWTFIVWGALNGIYLCVEKLAGIGKKSSAPAAWQPVRVFITFNLICFTWIFFRAHSFEQAWGIIRGIFEPKHFWTLRIQDTSIFTGMLLGLLILLLIEFSMVRKGRPDFVHSASWRPAFVWIVSFTLLIILFGVSAGDQFIYFQF
jgi:alginate O-acetyltransferase complex protein AlgI